MFVTWANLLYAVVTEVKDSRLSYLIMWLVVRFVREICETLVDFS